VSARDRRTGAGRKGDVRAGEGDATGRERLPARERGHGHLPVVARDPELAQQALRAVVEAVTAGLVERVQEPLLLIEGPGQGRHVRADRGIREALTDRHEILLDGGEVRSRAEQRSHDRDVVRFLLLREVRDPNGPRPRNDAALRRLDTCDRAQERRLPAAVGTDEADPRAILDAPREVGEDRAVAVRARDPGEVGDDHAAI
jgi:hypothetical protein